MVVRCSNPSCRRILTNPESIIRGMGPICYGKSYVYSQLLKNGKSREDILKIPEEEILKWAHEEVKRYRKEIMINKKRNNRLRLRIKRLIADKKRDKNQKTLIPYLKKESNEFDPNRFFWCIKQMKYHRTIREVELEELYKERERLTRILATTSSNEVLDQFDKIIKQIKELEEMEVL